MAHVGVAFGGRSVEHQVSIRSARTVVQGLREAGHAVTALSCRLAPPIDRISIRGDIGGALGYV